jgi:hypothetical protein
MALFKISGKVIAIIKKRDKYHEKLYLRIKVDENRIEKIENSGAYSYYIRLVDNNAVFNGFSEYAKKVGRDEELDAYYVDLKLDSDIKTKLSLATFSMIGKKIEIEFDHLSKKRITIKEKKTKKIKIYE